MLVTNWKRVVRKKEGKKEEQKKAVKVKKAGEE
jgi:hypothetical protein